MDTLARDYHEAVQNYNGHQLAATISPIAPSHYLNRLDAVRKGSDPGSIQSDVSYALTKNANRAIAKADRAILDTWTEIYVAYWHAIGALYSAQHAKTERPDWARVYESWKELANVIIRGYSGNALENWTLPVLYLVGKHLRSFGIKADEAKKSVEGEVGIDMGGLQDDIAGDFGKNEKLEDAARVINRMFTLCISDRAPLEDSRKWGLYYVANLLFKTYFKLNSISLSKNILRAISASKADMPELESFPKSHVVTFKYYVGVIHFLEEDYQSAEENLTTALSRCHHNARRNKALILTYLIPTRLLTTRQLPSVDLLRPYPYLSKLFSPLAAAIRSGSLRAFDQALAAGETPFVKRRIYLTLERGRDICLRNLLRQVYLAAGTDEQGNRRTRIKVAEFGAGIRLGEAAGRGEADMGMGEGLCTEKDEVECLLANLIYKNLIKGYISRAHGMVVLSKAGAFPGTGI